MSTECFMVEDVMDCWPDLGVVVSADDRGDVPRGRVGAMCWRWHQLEPYDTSPRPMPHLGVMTVAGLVCLDCPDSDEPHGYWQRTGEPPVVTVTPSLNVNHDEWHGFLTDGVLTP